MCECSRIRSTSPAPPSSSRERPGRGLVEPHQRRMQFKLSVHSEIECGLQGLDGLIAAIRIAGIIGLAHAADDMRSCRAGRPAPPRRSGTRDCGRARRYSAIRPRPFRSRRSRVSAVSEISRQRRNGKRMGLAEFLPPSPDAAISCRRAMCRGSRVRWRGAAHSQSPAFRHARSVAAPRQGMSRNPVLRKTAPVRFEKRADRS